MFWSKSVQTKNNKPVRILHIIGSLGIGGTERHLTYVMPFLVKSGFKISVLSFGQNDDMRFDLESGGCDVIFLPGHRLLKKMPRTCNRVFRLLICIFFLPFVFFRMKPDILHFWLPTAYVLGALLTFPFRCKRVMSRRSLNTYHNSSPLIRILEKMLHSKMDLILGNSLVIKNELLQERIQKNKLGTIYNGVPIHSKFGLQTKRNFCREVGLPFDAFKIIMIANFAKVKGHKTLLRALNILHSNSSHRPKILLIGQDRGELTGVRALISQFGLNDDVKIFTNTINVSLFLEISDVAVSCSYEEGLSNSLLESLAAGLPILASRVGGNPEIVVDGKNGYLFDPFDPGELAEGINNLMVNKIRASLFGSESACLHRKRFSLRACSEQYHKVYSNLMDN